MFYLYKRFGIRYVIVAILLSIIVVIPRDGIQELPHSITGQVIKTSDKYCYVRFHEGVMKLYHEEDIRYGDTVQFTFKILDMSENTNDNAFNEKLYLYSQKIFYKGKLKQLSVKNSTYSLYQWIEDHLSSEKDVSNYQRLFLLGERTEDIQNEYQRYGTKHVSNDVLYKIPPEFHIYQPWEECSSAQLLIEVCGRLDNDNKRK